MNNAILASFLITSTALLLLIEHRIHHGIGKQNRALAEALHQAETKRDDLSRVLEAARSALGQKRSDLKEMKSTLMNGDEETSLAPFDPAKDGLWPADQPYFYLPKRLLPSATFQQFKETGGGLRLHPDTALALGMAPEQAAAIDQGFENLTSMFRNLEAQRLEPSATHASQDWPGEKTSYRIPALYEEMKSPMESFFAQNASILGESCEEVFNHWAQLCITGALGGFAPKARILTFTEVPLRGNRQLTRFEVAEEGGKQLYYNEVANPPFQELPPGLPAEFHRLPYEHLFGKRWDNRHKPEIRPQ